MKMRTVFIVVVLVLGLTASAILWNTWQTADRRPSPNPVLMAPHLAPGVKTSLAPAMESNPAPAETVTMPSVAQSTINSVGKPGKAKKQAKSKPPIQDPTARMALSWVGLDPDAEACWSQAINNPALPAEERKDLIEDLNEDGLSDPHHPTAEDMPLIASRIQLIESMAPNAMDAVNARAFAEAYKDLISLYSGQPAN